MSVGVLLRQQKKSCNDYVPWFITKPGAYAAALKATTLARGVILTTVAFIVLMSIHPS